MDRTIGSTAEANSSSSDERAAPAAEKQDRALVQSVAVAAKILKTLAAEGGALPLKRLAIAAAMPRAKVHRYLASLRSAGLVSQDPDSGEYRIGAAAVTIGLVGLGRMSPVRQLVEALPRLRDRINETVTAAIWGETGPTVIAMEESDRVVTMNVRIGTVLPLSTTAIGRLFLAFLHQAVTQRFLAAERRAMPAAKLPSEKQLEQLLKLIRAERISITYGALMPGVDAMAAPVFDYRGELIAAVCAVGRFEGMNARSEAHVRRSLASAAAELSKQLGYIETR
ncbi:MAG TPA: IclR family transcriptional regulator [Xanthobacteraceae bacterium]|jgi:DNA-binding IclR family transcriptional regulator